MRLKKLELYGFKSFADKTEVIFDEGVTCVVGPNGCGKSNISDSIRWVLGERSPKMLRGSKMEDIIFNGTDFRKPIAMAEVSLTIDNSDRGLPIDYNEVTITRRLYRSGESEYLINKTTCRLKDIQDLILDTGIGSNSYSMIEQGRIDYILNAGAEERRFLIEEAAGISKFKVKKEEAIRKLEKTEENRIRLNDIIQEVHKNIQYAERQAKRAAKYREELERLKNMEIRKAFWELKTLTEQKSAFEQELESLKNELAEIEIKIQESRNDQSVFQEQLRDVQANFSQAEANRYAIQSKMDQNDQQIRFHQEKLLEIASRKGQIDEEIRQLNARTQQAAIDMAVKEQEIVSVRNEKAKAGDELSQSESSLQSVEAELEVLKKQSDRLKEESFQAAAQTTKVRNEFHRLEAYLDNNTQQKKRQEASAARVRQESDEWFAKKEACQKELVLLSEKLENLYSTGERIEQETQENETLFEGCKKEIEDSERFLHEKFTRHELLKELERVSRADEDSLLAQSSEEEKSLIHSIRGLFKIQPGYEWALESTLELFCKSLITESWQTAENLFAKIQSQKPSAIGLFVRPENNSQSRVEAEVPVHPKITGRLSSFIEIQEDYRSLFEPFIQNVLVTEAIEPQDLESLAKAAWNFKLISPDGFVIGPEARIFYRGAVSAEQGEFKRTAELSQLENDIANLRDFLSQKTFEKESSETRLKELEQEKEQFEADKMDSLVRKESFESMKRGMDDRITSFKREMELFDFESRELESEYTQSVQQKAQLELELQHADEREKSLRAQLETLSNEAESLDTRRSLAVQRHAEVKASFSNLEDKENLLTQSLEIMREHNTRNTQRAEQLKGETENLYTKEQNLHTENARLGTEQASLEETRRQADVSLELIRQEKEKLETSLQELQAAFQQSQNRQREIQASQHQLEMKVMDFGYQQKTIGERLEQTYRIHLAELKEEEYTVESLEEREAMEQEISKLKEKVESLGTVNLLAIEEYEELKTRYEFLMTQQKDLEDAKEQLMESIRKINKTTKGLFEETFTAVQKNFQEYYQILFRGGSAKLVLVDETNPLESGIDIVVRPPGKKLQNISLMSGGEKALTSIALLFSLFKIKPSPYCVLDEVDAPLDEANIDRFLAVLKTFLHVSQFIIVTHNRKTIGMGDALYGVTMQEAGVSKIVSVKVNKDAAAPSPSVVAAKDQSASEEIVESANA